MNYQPIEIGNLIIKKPVVQGGMGVGVSLGGLAGAVAKAGGLGVISAAQIGFQREDFEKNPFEANMKAIETEYKKARKIAPEGVIGFNIMVALQHYKEYVIQAASLFVATKECDVAQGFKDKYVSAVKEDIQLVSSPVGMPGRAVRNLFTERVAAGEKQPIKKCYGCLKKCNPAEIPYCITQALITAAKGDAENGLVFCGANTYEIKEITTVGQVISGLLDDEIYGGE